MTAGLDRGTAAEFLTALEDLELPLLQWGITEGALTKDEVLGAIEVVAARIAPDSVFADPEEILEQLKDRALLVRVPGSSPPRFRTRMAETMRSTVHLRQSWPPRPLQAPTPRRWLDDRRLVADYRLHVAPRRYPRREVPTDAALADLRQIKCWGELQHDVASAQLRRHHDLARFQVDATRSIFESISADLGRGVIVGAGTGSGKTLAFYLPAMAAMAQHAIPQVYRIHTVALYPRNELLRDQMKEAVGAALAVAPAMIGHRSKRRALRIGALYGSTPTHSKDWRLTGDGSRPAEWKHVAGGLVCPFFTCPVSGCDKGDLVWTDADRGEGSERLKCGRGHVIDDGLVALTRKSMVDKAPDLLFTTTEMLSKKASDPGLGTLLGWYSGTSPRVVLLDEVHTYAGVHGAQVALLLRRWRHAMSAPATFVGLSATLRDAGRFFAQLVGLPESAVEHIEPSQSSMQEEGREYSIALRGDPISGTSLLSTTIQAAMLYGRVLDPDTTRDRFLHGSSGFIFTDDLDVTNRLYDDLRDAEGGQDRRGRPRRGRPVLAALRSPSGADHHDRYRDGQSWDFVEKMGRKLHPDLSGDALRIGRTSSQDAGVDTDADLIVSSPSLEVGVNDPRVGLVIQHKAPHDAAAFIQRRGRAGRERSMRPITVVILSDYGRDRLAYQAYESLFLPEVPARSLPVGNRYVLKIQAAQALLDWCGIRLRGQGCTTDPRELLTAKQPVVTRLAGDRQHLANLLLRVLQDPDTQRDLARHVGRALRLGSDEVSALLWEHPRSLLLGVVPTALRRMRANWEHVRPDPGAYPEQMLPEYITTSLFNPLNVPETRLALPFDPKPEVMPVARALREAVPGRVSRRFGHRNDEDRTWIDLPEPHANGMLELARFVSHGERQGEWRPHGLAPVQVIRPVELRLQAPPKEVATYSQGVPRWGTEIVLPDGALSPAIVPQGAPWTRHVDSVDFASHAGGNPLEVRRMTTGADCQTGYTGNRANANTSVQYTIDHVPAAMGFTLEVDAMRVRLTDLDLSDPSIAAHLASPAWRSLAFMTAVAEDPALDDVANVFQRDWLARVYLTSFAIAAFTDARPAEQIRLALVGGSWRDDLPRVLQALYRDTSGSTTAVTDSLIAGLTDLSQRSDVLDCLNRCALILTQPDVGERTASMAQRAHRDTLAAGVLAAVLRACPDSQENDLILDIVPADRPGDPATLWLSETAIGGLGIIERLMRYYAEDPRRFWGLVENVLGASDFEYVDGTITRLLRNVISSPEGPAARAIGRLRNPASASAASEALQSLRSIWADIDGYPRHTAVAALTIRLLRPGTSPATDAAALAVVDAWRGLEERLGFEVEASVIAYAIAKGHIPMPEGQQLNADQAFSMLWPRGRQARTQQLRHYQPYAPSTVIDRLLAEAAHDERLPSIDVTTSDWIERYCTALAGTGTVELTAPVHDKSALALAVRQIPALHVDRDVLRVYGVIRKYTLSDGLVRARVEMREGLV